MNFLADSIVKAEDLLAVNGGFHKKKMPKKTSLALLPNCAVFPLHFSIPRAPFSGKKNYLLQTKWNILPKLVLDKSAISGYNKSIKVAHSAEGGLSNGYRDDDANVHARELSLVLFVLRCLTFVLFR